MKSFTSHIIGLLLILSSACLAQKSVKGTIYGKVLDNSDMQAIPNTSVYLSGTTIGTLTDKLGNYKIQNVPAGTYDLVVALVGYKTIINRIIIKDNSEVKNDFLLESNPIQMNMVEVYANDYEKEENLKAQKKYRELFKKYFLGSTPFSQECVIENLEEITFSKNKGNLLQANFGKPISVINNALGYKINFEMKWFVMDEKTNSTASLYYPQFIELTSSDNEKIAVWNENRRESFQNSLRRFLLCLKDSSFNQNGYLISLSSMASLKLKYDEIKDTKEIVSYYQNIPTFTLKFRGYLKVFHWLTKNTSLLLLPFGRAEIDEKGYPVDPQSIQVYQNFAMQGAANILPDDLKMEL